MIDNDKISIAQQLVTRFFQGDFESVMQSLDKSIKQQFPVERLRVTRLSLTAQVGEFKDQVGAHTFQIPSAELVIVTCAFANASLDINVAFNEPGKIVGVTITQVGSVEQQYSAVYEPPAYVNQGMFKEQEVQIGKGEWVLPGTLSVPVGDGPFAAVLLVHGSGPNDRDETIGPNKPFRDLAWGLATQGIAGLIVLAGLCRPLEDTILDQFSYIYSISGTLSTEQHQHLDELKKQVALVKSPDLSLSTSTLDLPLGVSASYWLDLRGYHPEEMARGLQQPMLILQAEGDYQVTMEDFQIWKSALSGRSDVQFKSYAGLSHLLMPFEGGEKSTPAAYNVPGHVVEEVITDIAEWVKHVF